MTTKQFCRLCRDEIASHDNGIDLFDDAKNSAKCSEIISQHFRWLEIHQDDELSRTICTSCWNIVNEFHLLYNRVDAIHRSLNEKCWPKSPTSDAKFEFEIRSENLSDGEDVAESETSTEAVDNRKARKAAATKRNYKSKVERLEDERKISEYFNLNCEQCSMTFSTFFNLKSHQKSKHNLKFGFIYCCNKKINRHSKLIEHMNWHLNPDSFRCEICRKVYSDNYGLRLHMEYHDQLKIFECDICSKKFSRKTHLRHHLRVVHMTQDKKNHKCNECGKTFGLNSILQSHIRGVHQNFYRHICEICAKEFKSKDQYKRHRLDHLKESPKLTCICGARLKNANSLQAHIRRTHDKTPQTCPQCGKISPNKDALLCHIRYNHRNSRQLSCTLCDKMFKRDISLKEHMATHQPGFSLYVCPYCPRTFNSNANMYSHRKKMHPSEWQRDRTKSGLVC